MKRAHAWRSGLIEFRDADTPAPEGSLPLPAVDPDLIEVRARLSHDGKTLLVPGVPEAQSDQEAMEKLFAFSDWLERTPAEAG